MGKSRGRGGKRKGNTKPGSEGEEEYEDSGRGGGQRLFSQLLTLQWRFQILLVNLTPQEEKLAEIGRALYPLGKWKAGQNANVGLLPPSDSEDEEEEYEATNGKTKTTSAVKASKVDSDDSSEEDSDSEEDEAVAKSKKQPKLAVPEEPPKRRNTEELDPEQIAKDLARLELIRQRREEERVRRIKEEGFDRYAAPSDENIRPDAVPKGYPGAAGVKE